MNKAEELRHRAENCTELAHEAKSAPERKRFERMAEGWQTVADNQAWLDGDDGVSQCGLRSPRDVESN
jgi:hypothetical protein